MQQEISFWNRMSRLYDPVMRRDKALYEEIAARAAAFLKPEHTVLEVATGTGNMALALAGSVKHMEACDLSDNMIAVARQKARQQGVSSVRFSVRNAYDLGFPPESFDVALLVNGLHVIPHPEKALAEAKRVLKPGGLFIAPTFMQRQNNLLGDLQVAAMSAAGFRSFHQWSHREFLLYLKRQGFTIHTANLIKGAMPLSFVVASPVQTKNTSL